tara:strand:+ start:1709 stop:1921 length:213 start_codon:yes stop_codon:yes gene_type:complete
VKELIRTNDPVRLSWSLAVLRDAGIPSVVFDSNASIVEGSISAIERRIMVADENFQKARQALDDDDGGTG